MSEFFNPRGVAVIGASAKKGHPNNQIFKYSKEVSLNGKVFPVNPSADEIEGVEVYKNLNDIPEPVDLIVFAVGSKNAISTANDIKIRRETKGDAGAVVIVSAGFREMGTEESIELENEMISIIKSSGARVIGPNCQGVVDLFHGVNTTFSVPPNTPRGGLSIVSQSGAFATSFIRWAKEFKLVGANKFVTLGNMSDVDVTEVLDYLGEDEKTKVIAFGRNKKCKGFN
jgi:acetyltransferase